MADDLTAALLHYSMTPELALPRAMSAQLMAIGPAGYVSPVWADWTVLPGLSIYYDALYTGDLTYAASQFDSLLKNHTYTWLQGANGLISAPWLSALVDTSGGSNDGYKKTPTSAVVNAWAYAGMRAFAQLGRWLGRINDAEGLEASAAALKEGFTSFLFNGTSAVCDGLCALQPHTAVHSTFYALYAGLARGNTSLTQALASYVRARALENTQLGVPCGAYPVQFLLAALYEDGWDHGMAAYAVLTATTQHSWMNMMTAFNATTTMECWLPQELPNLSFSHIWSSSPGIIIPRFFFGLNPTSPAFATLDVRPQPGPVLQGSASLPTTRGAIEIGFQQTSPGSPQGCFSLSLTLPGGVLARAFLPLWGSISPKISLDGVPTTGIVENDYVLIENVVPGAHVISTC